MQGGRPDARLHLLRASSFLHCRARSQMHVFYEALGYMVSAQADVPTQDRLLIKLMEWPNQMWEEILSQVRTCRGRECV